MGLLSLFSLSLLLLPLVSSLACPKNKGYVVIKKGCFKLRYEDTPRDHMYARYDCQAEGNNVDLATIPDHETNQKLHEMAQAIPHYYAYGGAHIGLMVTPGYFSNGGLDFRWDNTAARYEYQNWVDDRYKYRCGKMSYQDQTDGKWYTHHCDTGLKAWFCEYKVTNYGRGLPEDIDPNVEIMSQKKEGH